MCLPCASLSRCFAAHKPIHKRRGNLFSSCLYLHQPTSRSNFSHSLISSISRSTPEIRKLPWSNFYRTLRLIKATLRWNHYLLDLELQMVMALVKLESRRYLRTSLGITVSTRHTWTGYSHSFNPRPPIINRLKDCLARTSNLRRIGDVEMTESWRVVSVIWSRIVQKYVRIVITLRMFSNPSWSRNASKPTGAFINGVWYSTFFLVVALISFLPDKIVRTPSARQHGNQHGSTKYGTRHSWQPPPSGKYLKTRHSLLWVCTCKLFSTS